MLPVEILAEIYRTPDIRACDERALVLGAVGIEHETQYEYPTYVLYVRREHAPAAREHIARYEIEREQSAAARRRQLQSRWVPAHPGGWIGALVYAAVLIGIGLLIRGGWWPADAFERGEVVAGLMRAGQWWRAWTALTLHVDGAHLLANLVAGLWFGLLAARQLGVGHAWFLTVSGAALANLFEAAFGPATHRSVGASTAVFTALGLLSAHAWGLRARWQQHWAARIAPLVGGVILLGWAGSGQGDGIGAPGPQIGPEFVPSVDVAAHVLGFVIGALFGWIAAREPAERWLARAPQWASGAAALASMALAWGIALLHAPG